MEIKPAPVLRQSRGQFLCLLASFSFSSAARPAKRCPRRDFGDFTLSGTALAPGWLEVLESRVANMIPVRDTIPSRYAPVVTWALIGTNAVVFLFELSLGPAGLERFFYLFGMVPARYSHPGWASAVGFPVDDYWPFLTSTFLHGGWLHILGNMWTLWIFGDNVEDRMGGARFLVFYLLAGLAAGLTHWFTNPDSIVPAVGASGAIAGVLGAYFAMFPHSRVIVLFPVFFWPFFFELPAVTYLLFWFLSQVFGATLAGLSPEAVGGVAWSAHIGGFLAGLVLHRLFLVGSKRVRRGRYRDEYGIEAAWAR
jgi:membrane associated rhomboid family serine protease